MRRSHVPRTLSVVVTKVVALLFFCLIVSLPVFYGVAQTEAEERQATPIDISKACTMGFADEVDNDATGGWTDQGRGNDLSAFPIDQKRFASIEFNVVDPSTNSGRSCIMLKGPQRLSFPSKVVVDVRITGAYIYLLHATAWTPEVGIAGKIELDYEGGASETIPVVIGRDVADWWFPRPLENGQIGWLGKTREDILVGVYVSRFVNPFPKRTIERLIFHAGDAVWGIIAVSLSGEDLPVVGINRASEEPFRGTGATIHREIPLKDERSLDVEIELGSGEIELERAVEGKLLDADLEYPHKGNQKPVVIYNVRDGQGVLVIELERDSEGWGWWNWGDDGDQKWSIRLTDNIPISLKINMGAGKSHLDLTGLRLKKLTLKMGAGETAIRFDMINPEIMEMFDIDAGAAQLRARNLGNANFTHLSFKSGVGDCTLDFNGDLKRKADADISMGIGSLTLRIPEKVGTRIKAVETLLTGTSVSGLTKKGRYYTNGSYGKSDGDLSITIDQAIGSLRIETHE
jgi:hypothetical protein